MSLPNPNKPVTEQRLYEFYQKIKTRLGFTEMPAEDMSDIISPLPSVLPRNFQCTKFDKSMIYSTDEKIVGCWIDGRPVYQKVFVDTSPEVTTNGEVKNKVVNLNIPIKELVFSYGVLHASSGAEIPMFNETTDKNQVRYTINNHSHASYPDVLTLYCAATLWSNKPVTIIAQYTKTTDAANSFKLADENDYSTTEHVVGTWIDGKPVYQKTFTGTLLATTLNNNTYNETATSINIGANVKEIIKSIGLVKTLEGFCQTLPTIRINNGTIQYLRVNISDNTASTPNILKLCNAWYLSDTTYEVTIQYTKTTN